MAIHLEQIKTNNKFHEKKSGFVYSEFVKTCDELVTEKKYHENQAVQKKFSVKQ